MKHKEYGSDFYDPIASKWLLDDPNESLFSNPKFELFFSGRSALYHLLSFGIKKGWAVVYVPSYYCHEVFDFIQNLPIELQYYPCNPKSNTTFDSSMVPDRADCVFVSTSYFGMKTMDLSGYKSLIIIEDLTHDLLAYNTSKAHYCFGSLRKELPVGVGGFCYSPQGLIMPTAFSNTKADTIASMKVEAMRQKHAYLEGNISDKNTYRNLFTAAELDFEKESTQAGMPEIARKQLFSLDVKRILKQKAANLNLAYQLSIDFDQIFVFRTMDQPSFGLMLGCSSSELRNSLRSFLIKNQVYPAVLWPDQKMEEDKKLEDTLLFIHTDFRYTEEDISAIIKIVKSYFANA